MSPTNMTPAHVADSQPRVVTNVGAGAGGVRTWFRGAAGTTQTHLERAAMMIALKKDRKSVV